MLFFPFSSGKVVSERENISSNYKLKMTTRKLLSFVRTNMPDNLNIFYSKIQLKIRAEKSLNLLINWCFQKTKFKVF